MCCLRLLACEWLMECFKMKPIKNTNYAYLNLFHNGEKEKSLLAKTVLLLILVKSVFI